MSKEREVATAKSKETVADFMERKMIFLQEVVATVEMEEIPLISYCT